MKDLDQTVECQLPRPWVDLIGLLPDLPELVETEELAGIHVDEGGLLPVLLVLSLRFGAFDDETLECAFGILAQKVDMHLLHFVVLQLSDKLPEFAQGINRHVLNEVLEDRPGGALDILVFLGTAVPDTLDQRQVKRVGDVNGS